MRYTITDAEGNDLLGCDQEGIRSARCAARTLVMDDGEPSAHILPEPSIQDMIGYHLPVEDFRKDEWGNLVVRCGDLSGHLI